MVGPHRVDTSDRFRADQSTVIGRGGGKRRLSMVITRTSCPRRPLWTVAEIASRAA
jgi:hypothetical protein